MDVLNCCYGLLNLQTPLQTPIQTPLPGPGETPNYNIPTGPSDYSSGNDAGGNADVKGGRQAFMVKFFFFFFLQLMF